jgi:hypothetical protein
LTYRELAERSGESAGTLSWWSHRLRQEAARKKSRAFVELVPAGRRRGTEAEDLEVVLLSGRRIRIGGGFDEAVLRRVVAVLEREC